VADELLASFIPGNDTSAAGFTAEWEEGEQRTGR
jgi:hypothetical protein